MRGLISMFWIPGSLLIAVPAHGNGYCVLLRRCRPNSFVPCRMNKGGQRPSATFVTRYIGLRRPNWKRLPNRAKRAVRAEKIAANRLTITRVWCIIYSVAGEGGAHGSIAQLVEHLPYKQGVTGSSPVVSTTSYVCGPVVQLVRTLACHARGRRFEPVPGRHICLCSSVGRARD